MPPAGRLGLEDGRGHLVGKADYLRTRNRRMVTAPDRVLLTGSRSIRARPGEVKRMPSPSSTGSTYTRISSTNPRCRHWPAKVDHRHGGAPFPQVVHGAVPKL